MIIFFQTISQLNLQIDTDINTISTPTSFENPYCDVSGSSDSKCPSPVTIEMQPMPFHTLILDLGGVCFIDLMGVKVLTKVDISKMWIFV